MCEYDLLSAIGAAQDEYVYEACFGCAHRTSARIRFCLVAAIVALVMLLAGCAAWFFGWDRLVLVDHTIAEATEESGHGPFVAGQILSMQGYEGIPTYNALQEWLEYEADYVRQNPDCRFQSTFHRPDAYQVYSCYSQEMVDKVDEVCQKYGLHVIGKSTFLNSESEMEEHGLTYVLSPDAVTRCFYGYLHEDGSFVAEGELVLSDGYDRVVQFQMHNIRKDAFYPVSLGINGMASYTQWNYKTQAGFQALMALNNTTGLIITENEDHFITIIIEEVPDANMIWLGLPDNKAFLEAVCDNFVYPKP